ncbi:MAG TPA: chromo domain-containing protein, partial [Pyrinomonadaceae bacterium]|nr:chromo domain-containing protein [Pyrinomonadaceae bacterium]
IDNNSSKFPGRATEQPGEVAEGRWEVEKILEYRTAPRTGKNQYLVRWKGYNSDEDKWIDFEDISLEIVQDFWAAGNYGDTFKRRRSTKPRKNRRTRDDTKSIIQQERDRVLGLTPEDHDITSAATNVAEDIFNMFLRY